MPRATILLAACTAVLLTACGQKGPLRLPDKGAAVVTSPQTSGAPVAPATPPATAPTDKPKTKNADSQPPQ